MKRIFLVAFATCLTLATVAADKGKSKKQKGKKVVKIEKVCPLSCPKTGCAKM